MKRLYSSTVNYQIQAERAAKKWAEYVAWVNARVEALGGEITYPMFGQEDYCEISGITAEQYRAIVRDAP